jgi:hypothetical protein
MYYLHLQGGKSVEQDCSVQQMEGQAEGFDKLRQFCHQQTQIPGVFPLSARTRELSLTADTTDEQQERPSF